MSVRKYIEKISIIYFLQYESDHITLTKIKKDKLVLLSKDFLRIDIKLFVSILSHHSHILCN